VKICKKRTVYGTIEIINEIRFVNLGCLELSH